MWLTWQTLPKWDSVNGLLFEQLETKWKLSEYCKEKKIKTKINKNNRNNKKINYTFLPLFFYIHTKLD